MDRPNLGIQRKIQNLLKKSNISHKSGDGDQYSAARESHGKGIKEDQGNLEREDRGPLTQ